jgi:hypothetical protein
MKHKPTFPPDEDRTDLEVWPGGECNDLQAESEPTSDANLLVARLKRLGSGNVGTISSHHCPLLNDAADEITRLRAELQRAMR